MQYWSCLYYLYSLEGFILLLTLDITRAHLQHIRYNEQNQINYLLCWDFVLISSPLRFLDVSQKWTVLFAESASQVQNSQTKTQTRLRYKEHCGTRIMPIFFWVCSECRCQILQNNSFLETSEYWFCPQNVQKGQTLPFSNNPSERFKVKQQTKTSFPFMRKRWKHCVIGMFNCKYWNPTQLHFLQGCCLNRKTADCVCCCHGYTSWFHSLGFLLLLFRFNAVIYL